MNNDMIRTYSYRISQATRSQLVVITYDIITDYLNEALNDDASSGYKEKLHMAMRGIDQLITGLDMEYEISVQLYQLYNYMKRTLISAQVSGERDSVSRVITMLGKLRTSFLEVSQKTVTDNSILPIHPRQPPRGAALIPLSVELLPTWQTPCSVKYSYQTHPL